MQFLFPGFLWALAALSIPVILHLFYFRRYKKVYFSNVRFLREVKEETSARNKLRNLLILLARCLALAFLVFAFAQPFIAVDENTVEGDKAVSVYIDNSFSMQAFGDDLPLLDKAIQRAREVILAYGETDKYQILTNDLDGSSARFMSREEALAQVEEIEISPAAVPMSRVINFQQRSLDNDDVAVSRPFLVSDFQRSVTDFPQGDTGRVATLIPVESVQKNNVGIDSAWFEEPIHLVQQTSRIILRISNYSNDDVENIKLTSTVDGQEKPVSTFDIEAKSSVYDTVSITVLRPGWHEITLRITDFPVQFDDSYHMTFYVKELVRILAVHTSQPDSRLTAAFSSNTLFEMDERNAGQLNYSDFRNYDLIIVDEIESVSSGLTEALYSYVAAGGNVLFFPAADANLETYNAFLSRCGANTFGEYSEGEQKIGMINTESGIFRNVYVETNRNLRLPATTGRFPVQVIQQRGGERLLTYRDGEPFLVQYTIDRGNLIVCSAPLNEDVSGLSKSAELFIPLVYNAAVISNSQSASSYVIGDQGFIEVTIPDNNSEKVLRFEGPLEFIPRITPIGPRWLVDPAGQVRESGFYSLYSGDTLVGVYAFNYDRRESDLASWSFGELRQQYGSQFDVMESASLAAFASALSQKEHGITLWRWCIIFALAFLGLEILLIRVWKT